MFRAVAPRASILGRRCAAPSCLLRLPTHSVRCLAVHGLEPLRNLLARPAMVVVEVNDDRSKRQPFLATVAAWTAANRAFEAVKEPLEVLCRVDTFRLSRQPIHAFVRRTERTGRTLAFEIVAVRLLRPPLSAG